MNEGRKNCYGWKMKIGDRRSMYRHSASRRLRRPAPIFNVTSRVAGIKFHLCSSVSGISCFTAVMPSTLIASLKAARLFYKQCFRSPSVLTRQLKLQTVRAFRLMCKHTVVHSCYVSRGMGVTKVSNSKSDLPGHARSLLGLTVLFDRPRTISY